MGNRQRKRNVPYGKEPVAVGHNWAVHFQNTCQIAPVVALRDNTTQLHNGSIGSISLVDRLRKLTLPALSDVESGLENYTQTKERAEELEAKIERTDGLIDKIVYELYGLTEEEIEIVEETVSG